CGGSNTQAHTQQSQTECGKERGDEGSLGFKTKDAYIIVAAGNDQQFVKVCKVLNLNELAENPKYKSNTLRVQHRKELLQLLAARFSEESTANWLRRFEGTGVPCGPINSIQQVFSDPQVVHNGLILELDHPTSGRISVPGPAVRFNSFEFDRPAPPPVVGQHTVEVLKGILGYRSHGYEVLGEHWEVLSCFQFGFR
ncbi:succinate--hydroxymethylglutarate CoA-transferase isoform X1, partial [Clarias magur]